MKLYRISALGRASVGRFARNVAAFTMVELALCIGIVAFAMVAIMGVMPSGLNVQRQNREDTIIDQEGPQWINILRDGQFGWGDLTNYVEYVQIEHTPMGVAGGRQVYRIPGPLVYPPPEEFIASTADLISLLSIPKYEADTGTVFSNRVTAVFRSLAGAQNARVRYSGIRPTESQFEEFTRDAFRYQLEIELIPVSPTPTLNMTLPDPDYTNVVTQESIRSGGLLNAYRLDPVNVIDILKSQAQYRSDRDALSGTLYDLRLTFRWPLYKVGDEYQLGAGSRTFRTQISGRQLFSLYTNNSPSTVYWPGTTLRPRRFDPTVINRDLTL